MPRARSCSVCIWGLFFPLCGGSQSSATNTLCQIIRQAKKHPSLSPSLIILIGAGGAGAALDMMCLALYNPDVSWDRKNNPALRTNWVPMSRFYPVYMGCSKRKKDGPRHLNYQVLYRAACGQGLLKDIHAVPPLKQETLLL